MATRAILSNFFGEQGRQNHPQYLSGLSRALFPTTFLETALYEMEHAWVESKASGNVTLHQRYLVKL